MSQEYLVSTFSSQKILLKTEVWDSSQPFGMGCPFQWVLEKTSSGIRVRHLKEMTVQEFSESKISHQWISLGKQLQFRIQSVRRDELDSTWNSLYLSPQVCGIQAEEPFFKRTVLGSLGALVVFVAFSIVASVWLKPNEESLVPPQFAKVILSPPKAKSDGSNDVQTQSGGKTSGSLVRAFQSKELQKSTQKLFSASVLSLLSKSDLLSNSKSKSALNTLLNQSQPSRSPSSFSGLTEIKAINVGALGGGATGQGVGYGKGERASVTGQGKSFVSLNTPDSQVEEGLTKDEVGKVIHEHIAEVRYCYESAMIQNPDVQGKMVVDFVIQGSGTVKSAQLNHSTVNNPSLDQCILSRLVKWKFPKPKGGVDVAVSYPFIFKSLGK